MGRTPKALPKSKTPPKNDTQVMGGLRALGVTGAAFLFGGVGVIGSIYHLGLMFVFIGFMLLFIEIVTEPVLCRAPLEVHCLTMFLWVLFASAVIFAVIPSAPHLNIYCYAMFNGNHDDGVDVGGITWNSHYTELRVAVSNDSNSDYEDFYLNIAPDNFARDAKLFSGPKSCELHPNGPVVYKLSFATKSGPTNYVATKDGNGQVDIHDSSGGEWKDIAYGSGFKLQCSRLLARNSVNIVFALVTINQDLVERSKVPIKNPKDPKEWGVALSEWSGAKSELDFFVDRPKPCCVIIEGGFKNLEQFQVSRVESVNKGD